MGAGASAADKAQLQRAYAAWEKATAPGQPELSDEAFLDLLKTNAPGLHAKATEAGTGASAAASLKAQFESAQRKLQMRALGSSSGSSKLKAPNAATPAPPALQKLYSWAPDKGTNLQRGLAAGTAFKSEPLLLLDLKIGGITISALLDTGAEHCAMSQAGSTRCGLQPLVDENFGGVVGGIGTATKQGRVHYAKVSLPAAENKGDDAPLFEVAFDVMSWPEHVNFEAIIGIDFLARYKATIDVCGKALCLTPPDWSDTTITATLRKDGA